MEPQCVCVLEKVIGLCAQTRVTADVPCVSAHKSLHSFVCKYSVCERIVILFLFPKRCSTSSAFPMKTTMITLYIFITHRGTLKTNSSAKIETSVIVYMLFETQIALFHRTFVKMHKTKACAWSEYSRSTSKQPRFTFVIYWNWYPRL